MPMLQRESASLSRQRKKKYLQELEEQVAQSEAELKKLRQAAQARDGHIRLLRYVAYCNCRMVFAHCTAWCNSHIQAAHLLVTISCTAESDYSATAARWPCCRPTWPLSCDYWQSRSM
jgi:hypothetical protein